MSFLNKMEAERVGGFSDKGKYCVWCGRQYSDAYFRYTVDVCAPCDNFRMRHFHDLGNFFMRTVNNTQFRVYVPFEPQMTEKQIDDKLKSMI